MRKLSKKKQQPLRNRNSQVVYKRQNAYHYSAKRSNADRLFDRSDPEEDKQQNSKLPARPKRLWALGTLGFMALLALYCTSLSTTAQIHMEGGSQLLRDKALYQSKANQLVSSSLFNRSKLLINRDKISESLQSNFQEFSTVSVSTPVFLYKPQITIRVAEPALLIGSNNRIYVVDTQGRALFDTVANKPSFDTAKLPFVQDQSSHQIELGKAALTAAQVDYIHEIRVQSDAKSLSIESILLTAGGGELDVRYSGAPYFVKFNLFEKPRPSIGTFFATKEKLEKDGVAPGEYIDVRIPERAYVK